MLAARPCRRAKALLVSGALVLACTLSGGSPASAAPDPATSRAAEFFGNTKVYTFHLTIAAADFTRMPPPNGRSGGRGMRRGGGGDITYTKVNAGLEFEGKPWGTVAVRYKGNSSYGGAPSELKRSLKVEFNSPDKTRTFFGLTTIDLNNNAFDPSQMRETLAYDTFRRAGVTAPRTAYAKVYVTVPGLYTREYAGLFTVIEQIDQKFFQDRWGRKVGLLVKPEGLRGLPYLGEAWASYAAPYASKVTAAPDDAARFLAFVKFVNQATDEEFASHLSDYLDVDGFLRFLAVEVVLVNSDSPLAMNHNYWLAVHPVTGKVAWLPWDMNMAFGGFGGEGVDLSLTRPSSPGMFPLADRVLASPDLAARYERVVRDLMNAVFAVPRLTADMQTIGKAIRQAVAEDTSISATAFERSIAENAARFAAPGPAAGGFGRRGGPPLVEFVTARVESVAAQLAGTRTGTPGRGRGFGGPRPFGN